MKSSDKDLLNAERADWAKQLNEALLKAGYHVDMTSYETGQRWILAITGHGNDTDVTLDCRICIDICGYYPHHFNRIAFGEALRKQKYWRTCAPAVVIDHINKWVADLKKSRVEYEAFEAQRDAVLERATEEIGDLQFPEGVDFSVSYQGGNIGKYTFNCRALEGLTHKQVFDLQQALWRILGQRPVNTQRGFRPKNDRGYVSAANRQYAAQAYKAEYGREVRPEDFVLMH